METLDILNLNVTLCNEDELVEKSLEISGSEIMETIGHRLGLHSKSFEVTFFKQCKQIQSNEKIGKYFEDDDTVNVFCIDTEGTRSSSRNITNESRDEIILVVPSFLTKKPIFVPGGQMKSIRFGLSNWSNKLELYRKLQKDFRGEVIFKGKKYDLPGDKNVLDFLIDDHGVKKMIKYDNVPKPVNPRDEEVLEKYEREFYEPINKELTLKFRNTGKVPLFVVSGKKHDFDASPVINAGTETNISIKKSEKGLYEFGVYSEEWSQSLTSTRCENYRDGDRINRKDWLGWAFSAVGSIAGGLAGQ